MSYAPQSGSSIEPVKSEQKRKFESEDQSSDGIIRTEGSMGSVVAGHYNKLEETGLKVRNQSRIVHLRNFNNWIKSHLIQLYINLIRSNFPSDQRLAVIDLGCGKGGDLLKWTKANIRHLICVDIAETSLSQCKDRYDFNKTKRFGNPPYTAEFIQADCTKVCFQPLLRDPSQKVHLVSCQFALHYSFESLSQAETMIKNASANLRPGGYFILTIPDANDIMRRLAASSDGRTFGNEVFRIEFPSDRPARPPLFGDQYRFFLEGVVDCPEFLVHPPTLKRICQKYGLECVHRKRFHELYDEAYADHQGRNLLHKMFALEEFPRRDQSSASPGEYSRAEEYLKGKEGVDSVLTLSQSEWEAVNLYTAYAFQKQTPPPSAP